MLALALALALAGPSAELARGSAALQRGDLAAAVESFQQAVPNAEGAPRTLAAGLRTASAVEVSLEPSFADARLNLGVAYRLQGQRKQAKTQFQARSEAGSKALAGKDLTGEREGRDQPTSRLLQAGSSARIQLPSVVPGEPVCCSAGMSQPGSSCE